MVLKRVGSLVLAGVLVALPLQGLGSMDTAAEGEEEPEIPSYLQELMEEKGFTGIDPLAGDILTDVVFQKADGTKTLYIYDSPIKYEDADGTVRFIDPEARQSRKVDDAGAQAYAYENREGGQKTYLPKRIQAGVLSESDGRQLEIFPTGEKNSRVKMESAGEDQRLVYADAVEPSVDLAYTYTMNGVQEEIILEKYTGENTFTFRLDTHGLVPSASTGHMIGLEDPVTGETVCTLSDIELRDASYAETLHYSDVSFENTYTIQPDPDGEGETPYLLTVTLDEDFLQNPNTAYPLTGRYNYAWITNSSDTTVYQNRNTDNSAATMDYVGNRSTLGNCIKLVQFDTSCLKYINPDNIIHAGYDAQVLGAPSAWYIDVVVPNFIWDPSTVRYSQINSDSKYTKIWSIYMNNTTERLQGFIITDIVKQWLQVELQEDTTSLDSRQGIAFVARNCPTNSYRAFRSNETASSLDRPTFAVEFYEDDSLEEGYYFIRNFACDYYLDAGSGGIVPDSYAYIFKFKGDSSQLWYVKEQLSGVYTLSREGVLDQYLTAEDEYGCPLSISAEMQYWRIVQNADGSYRIMVDLSERQAVESANGSTELNTAVQTWGYGGAPNQKWIFEKATQTGGAKTFREETSTKVNCFGYAMELKESPYLFINNYDIADTFFTREVVPYIKSKGWEVRVLRSEDELIRPNEYKVAMRIVIGYYFYLESKNQGFLKNDYHFVVKTSTGEWAEKHGEPPPANLTGVTDLDDYTWDFMLYNSDGTLGYWGKNAYTEPTIYFAVAK